MVESARHAESGKIYLHSAVMSRIGQVAEPPGAILRKVKTQGHFNQLLQYANCLPIKQTPERISDHADIYM